MMDSTGKPAEASPHADTLALLPWLANGTLGGPERARADAHLALCPACRTRLEWERALRAGEPPVPPLSAVLAFGRLAPRLGEQEGGAGKPVRWSSLAAANDPRCLRSLAAVQLGVIFVLGLVIGWPAAERAPYRSLGARPAAQGNIVVSFDPATPERELRRILQASGARLVDGPTASDAWVLAVAPSEAAPALRRLRAEPAVTLAEPLDAGAGQ